MRNCLHQQHSLFLFLTWVPLLRRSPPLASSALGCPRLVVRPHTWPLVPVCGTKSITSLRSPSADHVRTQTCNAERLSRVLPH